MNRKDEFMKIFRQSFHIPAVWSDWFFNEVYDHHDARILEEDGKPVSIALSTPVTMSFRGREIPAKYLSCIATATAERGKGYMGRLLRDMVNESASEGDAFVMLIPERRGLYSFYDRFGFASVFYTDEQRYTSLHTFVMGSEYVPVEPSYGMFRQLESMYPDTVRHSATDYSHILSDLAMDGGKAVAVADGEGGAAMAFFTSGETTVVKHLIATDSVAAESALAIVRTETPGKPIVVQAPPGNSQRRLRVRGMARIADAATVLGATAATSPHIHTRIRLRDNIVKANNGIFSITAGTCIREDSPGGHIDLDIDVSVLTSILFSAPKTAAIFGLPGSRPLMALMLD